MELAVELAATLPAPAGLHRCLAELEVEMAPVPLDRLVREAETVVVVVVVVATRQLLARRRRCRLAPRPLPLPLSSRARRASLLSRPCDLLGLLLL